MVGKKIKGYIQHDAYSCGPIAMMNTLKSLGYKTYKKDAKSWAFLMGTNAQGTRVCDLASILLDKSFKQRHNVAVYKNLSLADVKFLLRSGATLLLTVNVPKSKTGHYFTCTGMTTTGNRFFVQNAVAGRKTLKASEFKILLKRRKSSGLPLVFALYEREDI